jgi:predicted Zn-dependent peptidase
MKKTILVFFSVFLLGVVGLFAQSEKISFTEYDLPNGLHVILHQNQTVPVVAVSVLYRVGSKDETADRTGFAHFFEHLLFEGSDNMARGDYDKWVALSGGANNAYTTNDQTYYYEIMPSNQMEMGLWLESERMMHAKVLQEGVDVQREVVKEEKRQRYDNAPYGSLVPKAFELSFKQHPYNHAVIGSMEHLNAAKLEEFMAFYKKFYVPNNAVLTLAGNLDIEATKVLIAKYFGDIPKGTQEIVRNTIVEPALAAEVRETVYDNIQLPAVIHIFRTPAMYSDDYFAFDMLSSLLTQGRSSRMNKALVDTKQLALQTASFPFPLVDPGIALAFALANSGVAVDTLEMAMDDEYERSRNELISENEFQKLRNQFENDLLTGNETMGSVAENLAKAYIHFGNTNLYNELLARYMKISREDIKRVAQKYLRPENRVTLIYLPKAQEPQR